MIRNIIFDLGKVLINWDLPAFAESYTEDREFRQKIVSDIFTHTDWHKLDEGTISEDEAVKRFSKRLDKDNYTIEHIISEARKIMTLKENTYKELLRYKKKYNVYCISNMSLGSWEAILEMHTFYKEFNGIIISAKEKMIKPDIKIFTTALKRFNIKAEESIFIDDLKENILAAESLGIKGIVFDESADCWEKLKKL